MTGSAVGMVLGALFGVGAWTVLDVPLTRARRRFETRVLVYLRDLPAIALMPGVRTIGRRPLAFWSPLLAAGGRVLERVLGGGASVESRLARLGSPMTLHDFRVAQATAGLVGFAIAAVPAALLSLSAPGRAVPLFVVCCVVGVVVVLVRENLLTSAVTRRERLMLQEFPTIASLLALAVAAGESPVAALGRVVATANGELSAELARVLAAVRTGTPVAAAFDELAARTGLPVLARFAEGLAIAVERGTPLADLLHAQAADVREARRRQLIETGARKEVLMMVPVVFLVLPVVVVFAFYPGLVGLRMVV